MTRLVKHIVVTHLFYLKDVHLVTYQWLTIPLLKHSVCQNLVKEKHRPMLLMLLGCCVPVKPDLLPRHICSVRLFVLQV